MKKEGIIARMKQEVPRSLPEIERQPIQLSLIILGVYLSIFLSIVFLIFNFSPRSIIGFVFVLIFSFLILFSYTVIKRTPKKGYIFALILIIFMIIISGNSNIGGLIGALISLLGVILGILRTSRALPNKMIKEPVMIEEIFLIYNDGRLIKHLTRRLKPDMDNEILSSMLVAVQNFVKDSFRGELGGNLDEMKYGGMSILIGTGKHLLIAAVVSGEDILDMRQRITKTIDNIESEYKDVLKDWDGEIEKLHGIDKFLNHFVMNKY